MGFFILSKQLMDFTFELVVGGENYYYWNLFHSILVQDIVDTKYVFWDKFLKWERSMHD